MITKSDALDRFINERVLGERGFAWDINAQSCSYNHIFNGGCEIGQYLPEEFAQRKYGSYTQLQYDHPTMMQKIFEDYDSFFWLSLQNCHDSLAIKDYIVFERSLNNCLEYL